MYCIVKHMGLIFDGYDFYMQLLFALTYLVSMWDVFIPATHILTPYFKVKGSVSTRVHGTRKQVNTEALAYLTGTQVGTGPLTL